MFGLVAGLLAATFLATVKPGSGWLLLVSSLVTVTAAAILQSVSDRRYLNDLSHRYEQLRREQETLADSYQKQLDQERLLIDITLSVRQSLNLNKVMETAVTEVRSLLRVNRVLVYQFQPDWRGEVVAESVSDPEYSVLGIKIEDYCFENDWDKQYREGYIHQIHQVATAPLNPCYRQLLQSLKVQSNLVLPIRYEQKLWGLLAAHHCTLPRTWLNSEVILLKQVAEQLSIAISQAQLLKTLEVTNQKLQDQVRIDGLTQIPNRRRFDEYFHDVWLWGCRDHSPLALLLIDVDYFKNYNDFYGHLAGDSVLRKIGLLLSATVLRATDLVARYGGEEFVVVLPSTTLEGAKAVAQRLQSDLNQLKIPHEHSPVADWITVSIGVAVMVPDPTVPSVMLIDQADEALYDAKAAGRNCIMYAKSSPTDKPYQP
ncbi:sensor domain-containing diguanylate cyclase [Synechococcus elongatus IITB7]|uniref:GGDEF domain-containing protein n=1 Tax=Synechococcus elongatus TaxID=32046 RepID=UPI0030CE2A8B